jgi:hypothetical protein
MSSKIRELLEPHFASIKQRVNSDPDFLASANGVRCVFAISSFENAQESIIVGIDQQKVALSINAAHAGIFGLQARPEDWDAFFAPTLVRPYQSYWGVLRVLGHNRGIGVLGDQQSFAAHARLWRIILDRARDAVNGKEAATNQLEPPEGEIADDDAVTGKYMWLDVSEYGHVKLFYEYAGSGDQPLLFLHTAGSDSRQYHSLMNNKELQKRCTMYAFDLPAHGRSSLGSRMSPQGYKLTEDAYLGK